MTLLDASQIQAKINRLAMELYEKNRDENEIILVGINNKGYIISKKIQEALSVLTPIHSQLFNVRLNPAKPLEEIVINITDLINLNNKCIVIIDDVANTGRTIHYAFKPFLNILPKKIQTLVLIDRKHKLFPVSNDFVGLSLATTIQENIEVLITDNENLDSVVLN